MRIGYGFVSHCPVPGSHPGQRGIDNAPLVNWPQRTLLWTHSNPIRLIPISSLLCQGAKNEWMAIETCSPGFYSYCGYTVDGSLVSCSSSADLIWYWLAGTTLGRYSGHSLHSVILFCSPVCMRLFIGSSAPGKWPGIASKVGSTPSGI